jgi:hypothetical protein
MERRLVPSEVLRGIIDESEAIDSIDTIDPTVDGTGEIGRLSLSGPQATMCGAMISDGFGYWGRVIRMASYHINYQISKRVCHDSRDK